MSSDSDGIIAGPAPRGEPSDDDGIISGPPVASRARRQARKRTKVRSRVPPKQGKFNAWLLALPEGEGLGDGADGLAGDAVGSDVAGICACEWEFVQASADAEAMHASALGGSLGGTRAVTSWGYIHYKILDVWQLDELVGAPEAVASRPFSAGAPLELFNCCQSLIVTGKVSLKTCVEQMQDAPWRVLLFPLAVILQLFASTLPVLARSIRLTMRSLRDGLVTDSPPMASIQRWRRQCSVRRHQGTGQRGGEGPQAQRAWEDIVLELPEDRMQSDASEGDKPKRKRPVGGQDVDPMKLLRALMFSRHLKDQRDFLKL